VDFLCRENDGEEVYLDYYPSPSGTITAASPDGTTPRRIDESLKKPTARPCPGEALKRGLSYRARFLWFSGELNRFILPGRIFSTRMK
jgi:hypothetical protein